MYRILGFVLVLFNAVMLVMIASMGAHFHLQYLAEQNQASDPVIIDPSLYLVKFFGLLFSFDLAMISAAFFGGILTIIFISIFWVKTSR